MNINYLKLAFHIAATESEDISTQVGAVLVNMSGSIIGIGANRYPAKILRLPERFKRPEKYIYIEHAERNAIYAAAQKGYATYGSTMYASWFACADCARAIIAAGVQHVIGYKPMFDDYTQPRWQASIQAGNTMLDEAGVTRTYYEGTAIQGVEILFDGMRWTT